MRVRRTAQNGVYVHHVAEAYPQGEIDKIILWRVKSRNALMDAAYDDQVYVDDRTIDSHIKRLCKKLKVVDEAFDMIETFLCVGYRFKEVLAA
jgi:hypothetical protein